VTRLPLLVLGFFSLAFGVAGGLVRLGAAIPAPAGAVALHGALMVSGFLGTVIGLERAVALGRPWAYAAPLASGLGGLCLVFGYAAAGFALLALAAAALVAASLAVLRRQPSLEMATLAAGAAAWLAGNLALYAGAAAVPWWIAFFALTIGGERLELSRYLKRGAFARNAFIVLAAALLAAPLLPRVLGVVLVLLALWLFTYDLARVTVRQNGLPRYIAACLLSGYAWLGFGGALLAAAVAYDAALHAAGGAVSAVTALLAGAAEVAFCALRPPGHHAESERAMGFCLFNNVAVAARYALDRLGASRVLVLDWDVHHGNGTNDIFHGTDAVLYASIHQSPLYPGTGALTDNGAGEGEGHTVNLPVPPGAGHDDFVGLVQHVVVPIAHEYVPDLVLVSAGFDAHRDDPLANCTLTEDSYGAMASAMRRLSRELEAPLGFVLEGGYDLRALAGSVAATIEAAMDGASPPTAEPGALVARARAHYRGWWPSLAQV